MSTQLSNVAQHVQTSPANGSVPPVVWPEETFKSAFQAYLQSITIDNHPQQDWDLFQLSVTAHQARLVDDFHDLYALEHVRGFTPLPHQVETARRVLSTLHGRAILADEVGLGKTIEAGLVMKEYMIRGLARKVLILSPASLVLQWTRELNEKFRIPAVALKKAWMWTQYDVVVSSIDLAKRDPHREYVLSTDWDLVIVDEAHKLKNPKTKNWQTVNEIRNKYMMLLTATPIQNNLKELHTLITLLKPGHLGNTQQFVMDHMASLREAKDPSVLKSHISTVMVRNQRRDGVTMLPPRSVETVTLELSEQERAFYESVQSFMKQDYADRKAGRMSVLPLLTLQREICSSPYAAIKTLEKMRKRTSSENKMRWIDELLELARNIEQYTKVNKVLEMVHDMGDAKCIIFTEYRATQDFLLFMLRQQGVSAVPFRGGFKRSKKDWMTELFQQRVQVLVATESGGEGINLQFCHNVINYDLPWNPMRLEQRIGRVHRLGQDHPVQVYHLATRDTVEEHIVTLLLEKIRMFEHVIGELDFIVENPKFETEMEKQILDIAMTSSSDEELKERLEDVGESIQAISADRSGSS